MIILLRPLAALAAVTLFAGPAAAQDGAPAERINQVIVFGDDPCPAGEGDTIVVCARMEEDERYRIPPPLRAAPNDPRRESWTARVQALERVGRFGTDSCSPVGLGGFTGCTQDLVRGYAAEQQANTRSEWTNAVAEQRRLRAEGIDAAAAEEEADVVNAERAAAAARAAARDAAAAAADADIARGGSGAGAAGDTDPDPTPLPDPVPPR